MKESFLQVRGNGNKAILFMVEEDQSFNYQEPISEGGEVELMFRAEEEFRKRRHSIPGLHIREATASPQEPRPTPAETSS